MRSIVFIAVGADSVGSIHNLAGISIFLDRKIPHAANERAAYRKTQPISDSFALMESCASLLTSAAASYAWGPDRSARRGSSQCTGSLWKTALTIKSHSELLV